MLKQCPVVCGASKILVFSWKSYAGHHGFDRFRALGSLKRAKKVVSDSPGVVDFALRLVNTVLNLPDGQVNFLGNSNHRRMVINPADQKGFWG